MIEYLCEPFLDNKEQYELFYPEVSMVIHIFLDNLVSMPMLPS